jgi:L-seryl-tRNA(Ser) seleniumtransferase
MLQVTEDELRDRATAISSDLTDLPLQIAIGRGAARVGGGTLPKSTTSSITIEMVPKNCSPVEFAARLRKSAPPLIGYIANNRLKIDLRTIFPQQDKAVIEAIRAACFERV